MAPIVSARNLTVNYGRFTALSDFSVDVPGGCIGLLGPNGAGKTTLIKTLLGFVNPASGTAEVLGEDIKKCSRRIRQLVGLMPEQECHIPGMSAVEYVAYAGELAGLPSNHAIRRAHEVLEYSSLGEARYRKVETFSTGMKQRIKIAQALVHGPKLLLLDEPTNGLDPRGRREMLDMIRSITQTGLLHIIVSSHLLKDIERTCDSVVVVVGGKLRAQGSVKSLLSIEGQPIDVELREASAPFVSALQHRGIDLISEEGYRYRFQPKVPVDEVGPMLFEAAHETRAEIRGFEVARKTLEEAFLEVIR